MATGRKAEVLKEILNLEKEYPKDDLISNYADFLKVRDYLHCYQFNPIVFTRLIELADEAWFSTKRVNRLSLLATIKKYLVSVEMKQDGLQKPTFAYKKHPLTVEIGKLVFKLFKNTFEAPQKIGFKQLDDARAICNRIIINIPLTATEEEWLCTNVSKSAIILNRVLRYPIKSAIISKWAKDNFENDNYRHRRAELLSWVIDENPNFKIDPPLLIEDFEYMNRRDRQAIQDYKDEMEANKVIGAELDEFFPKVKRYPDLFDDEDGLGFNIEEDADLRDPELNLVRRFYSVPTKSLDKENFLSPLIPDFNEMNGQFYKEQFTLYNITMIWGIGYSRLNNELKTELLKSYYSNATHRSIMKVAKRDRNISLMKFVLEIIEF